MSVRQITIYEVKMKIKKFDVVEQNNNNKATILEIKSNSYLAEIVDNKGKTVETRNITQDEIKQIIFTR